MARTSVSDLVTQLSLPIVEEAGCELVDVEYVKEGGNWFLRVYIDKPGGVTLDDCEKVSKPLNQKLDEHDPIPHAFFLEVSSPGIERPLKKPRDFEKALGNPVEVKLYKAINNVKRFEGILTAFDENSITITDQNNEKITINKDQIAKVKKIFNF